MSRDDEAESVQRVEAWIDECLDALGLVDDAEVELEKRGDTGADIQDRPPRYRHNITITVKAPADRHPERLWVALTKSALDDPTLGRRVDGAHLQEPVPAEGERITEAKDGTVALKFSVVVGYPVP
jgi:hypothetical protein